MPLETNFNVAPYFDDYNEDKNYYKILFKPSVAVQARELNQMQTILQKQISRFGQHVFREGSIVLGGAFDLELDVENVRAVTYSPINEDPARFIGKTFTGLVSGVTGYCRAYEYDEDAAVHVFFIRYTSSSLSSSTFIDGEDCIATDGSGLSFSLTATDANGRGSLFSIAQGAVFSKGFFLAFPTQTVVLDKYSTTPTQTVGLSVSERLVTELNDPSLYDNAQGFFNENAPGAHRFLIDLTIETRDYDFTSNDTNFIPLLKIKNGLTEISKEKSLYSRVYDELAKRTADESGDYYVFGLGVRTREHLDTGTNEGVFTAAQGGDANKLSLDVDPGVAYVKGYEINKLITSHVVLDKSSEFNFINSQRINARTGGFTLINQIVGTIGRDDGLLVNIYDTAETRITSNITGTTTPTGNIIGTARIKNALYDSGVLGNPDARMRLYLYDLTMTDDVFANARGVGIPGSFFADLVLVNNNAQIQRENENTLIFPIGSSATRTVRDITGSPDTIFEFNRTESKTIDFTIGGGQFTVSVTVGSENVAFGDGTLGASEKRQLFVTVEANTDITLPGTVSGTSGNSTLIGSGTNFNNLSVGNKLKVNGDLYYINSIADSTTLTVVGTLLTSPSANSIFRSYTVGDYVDLTARGSTGVERTAVASSGTLTIDLKEVISSVSPSSVSCKISYPVERTSSAEIKKTLRANRFVKIDTSNNSANSVGPYSLGLPDVYKIRSIRLHTSAFSTGTEGSNVTSSFVLDNGQKDNSYGPGSIVHIGSLDLVNKHLLVELDHFEADFSGGFGYFSVDSYPIDDSAASNTTIFTYQIPTYKTRAGVVYNLRDAFDFRPYKVATANSSTTVAGSTINPVPGTTFVSGDGNGLRIVNPDSNITADYSFYLARRDSVALNTEGEFVVIKGNPGVRPFLPTVPDDLMPLASVFIAPYPSITETLARIENIRSSVCSSKMIASIRYTMRDIGVLDNRIKNLEYYNTLNLLEKSASDLLITDENGLDRFKNGFFVDGFVDHSLGATYNRDYNITVDKNERVIRPIFRMDAYKFDLTSSTSNIALAGSLINKNFQEQVLVNQPRATTIRNIEQSVFRFIGTLEISPDNDNWVDTTIVDKTFEFGNDIEPSKTMTTEWGSWTSYVTGASTSSTGSSGTIYNVYSRVFGDRDTSTVEGGVLIGTFTSYAEALAASRTVTRAKIEVVSGETTTTTFTGDTVNTRTGTLTTTTISSQTENVLLGSFVTDINLATYIRPQSIHIRARGLKANTRLYVYFDGENMSDYISPIEISVTTVANKNAAKTPVVTTAIDIDPEGSPLRSNAIGEATFILRLPETGKRFRVGTKEIIVTDSPTNAIDATTYSKGYFVANGLVVNKQNTIISTKTAVVDTTTQSITESNIVPGETTTVTTGRTGNRIEIFGPSCLAYSFFVDVPRTETGIFLTSVDVFFADVHPTLGVWFEIREMNNAGGITRTQVPYSEVWYTSAQIQPFLNPDRPTTPFKVTFPSPVFLQNNTQYALVVHTEGLNPDTYFWVSRLGETDVRTGLQVSGRQLTGTLFTTNNNLNYDIVPDVDLTCTFYRAEYEVSTAPTNFTISNAPTEFLNLYDVANDFTFIGETIRGSERLSFANVVGSNTIAVGDYISGSTSGVNTEIVTITSPFFFTTGIGYSNGETISVFASNGANKSISATISSIEGGFGVLRSYSRNDTAMILDSSNGRFFANGLVRGIQSNREARIDSFGDFKYSVVNFKPHKLTLSNTNILFQKRGYLSSTGNYSPWFEITADDTEILDSEFTILSRSREISQFGGNPSVQFRGVMTSGSSFFSPVVDISRVNTVFVYNDLNNDITDEDSSSGGALINRYISKTITLADGQDAEDILVKLASYRPPNSDVKVWVKIRHDDDPEPIDQKNWIALNYRENVFSSSVNKNNFIDFDYTFPPSVMANGVVQYVSNAITFSGYKQFAIKIGLMGTNTANPPRVTDLRAIALQK
jgi:hypothetical protein